MFKRKRKAIFTNYKVISKLWSLFTFKSNYTHTTLSLIKKTKNWNDEDPINNLFLILTSSFKIHIIVVRFYLKKYPQEFELERWTSNFDLCKTKFEVKSKWRVK